MTDENILVVRRALFDQLGAFQGLSFEVDRYLPALLARENNFFTAARAGGDEPRAEADHSLRAARPRRAASSTTCAGKKRASSGSWPRARSASAGT